MTPVDHRIERTKNRHSRAVFKDDVIVIRLGRNLTQHEEREHIEHLLHRMRLIVAKERLKTKVDPFRSILDGSAEACIQPPNGLPCAFVLSRGAGKLRARRTREGWHVSVSRRTTERTLHRFLWRLLGAFELPCLQDHVDTINDETLRVPVSRVRSPYTIAQWGSCSRNGVISLNAALLFLPVELLRYVIIHELAHRRFPNHSAAYWREVERVCPTAKRDRNTLKKYHLPRL